MFKRFKLSYFYHQEFSRNKKIKLLMMDGAESETFKSAAILNKALLFLIELNCRAITTKCEVTSNTGK